MSTEAAAPTTIEQFAGIDVRAGTIVSAEPLIKARKPAYRLVIDFGPVIGTRSSSAQITAHYGPDDLVGRQVCAVINLPPRRVAGFNSEVLTLGLPDLVGNVVLIAPERPVPDGARLY